jgi:hypothetical protein
MLTEDGEAYFRRRRAATADPFATTGAEGVADEPRNGSVFDDPGPEPPPDDGRGGEHAPDDDGRDEPTTWEPVDLGPWLSGGISQPEPKLGLYRSDGKQLVYPGREHAVLGETESGKTWFALGCVNAELGAGNLVVYVHFEEGDPGSTIERLRLLGATGEAIADGLRFVAPNRPARTEWITPLLTPAPALVVLDGINEGMSLHGADIMAADGASTFRRRLVVPFTTVGAATLACDHLPKEREGRSRDAYGSVHKGNALDGARIVLENTAPFGRDMRGVSYVFVTKDRPGQLRAHGRPTKLPSKTFMGTLVFDAIDGPEFGMRFYAPRDDDKPPEETGPADVVFDVLAALPDQSVKSLRDLSAQVRRVKKVRQTAIREAIDDLVAAGRAVEIPGKRGATGYKAVTVSPETPP